jgi:hypothetical protein
MSKKESKKSRRCMVCGKEVPEKDWFSINAGVTENVIVLWGQSTFVNNVDELVVLPNRLDFGGIFQVISNLPGGPRVLEMLKGAYVAIDLLVGKSFVPEKHLPGGPSSGRLRTTAAE